MSGLGQLERHPFVFALGDYDYAGLGYLFLLIISIFPIWVFFSVSGGTLVRALVLDIGYWRYPCPGHGVGLAAFRHSRCGIRERPIGKEPSPHK